jgi:CRISPR-associated protein Cas2
MASPKVWLVAYDIRDPKRLRRVHRFMVNWGTSLQFSVFAVEARAKDLARLKAGLFKRINPDEDDLRIYAIPNRGGGWAGMAIQKDGIILTGSPLARTLASLHAIPTPETKPEE